MDSDAPLPEHPTFQGSKLTKINISVEGVAKLLHDIKPGKANGPYPIPNLVLQKCSKQLAPALTNIFHRSLDTGTLPDDWLKANVSSIFKKGDKHLAENYWPVSLISVTSNPGTYRLQTSHFISGLQQNTFQSKSRLSIWILMHNPTTDNRIHVSRFIAS